MLDLIERTGLDPASLVGQVITLEDAGTALAAMDGRTAAGMTVVQVRREIR
jgi:alcohol dehydrogenase